MQWQFKAPVGMPAEDDFPRAEQTPHSQAWAVPEEIRLEDLPLRTSDDQLAAMVLSVWREYLLHDEVRHALSFLESAPYRVRRHPQVVAALADTRAGVAWMNSKFGAEAANTPADPNGLPLNHEVGAAFPAPLAAQLGQRFSTITSFLPPAPSSVVDFGCIDGTMTNRWAAMGYHVTGLDLSINSVRVANRIAAQHGTGAIHVNTYFKDAPSILPANSFDAATCSDVYEHVLDPVRDLLEPARRLVKPTGTMTLVTPHGAWMRGVFVPWAHPWCDVPKGVRWNGPFPRGHVVAPDVWSVTADFRAAGWWVERCYVLVHDVVDVPGQGSIVVHARPSLPTTASAGRDVSVFGPSEAVHPACALLASYGHRVTHYGDGPEQVVDFYDRKDLRLVPSGKHDVVVAPALTDVPAGVVLGQVVTATDPLTVLRHISPGLG